MLVHHPGIITGHFFGGKRVELAAHRVQGLRDIPGRALLRALEHQMLDKMGNAFLTRLFHPGAGAHPIADRNGTQPRYLLCDDPDSAGQRMDFYFCSSIHEIPPVKTV